MGPTDRIVAMSDAYSCCTQQAPDKVAAEATFRASSPVFFSTLPAYLCFSRVRSQFSSTYKLLSSKENRFSHGCLPSPLSRSHHLPLNDHSVLALHGKKCHFFKRTGPSSSFALNTARYFHQQLPSHKRTHAPPRSSRRPPPRRRSSAMSMDSVTNAAYMTYFLAVKAVPIVATCASVLFALAPWYV